MKFRSLCASALVGVMALSLVGGVASDAAVKSAGSVTVGDGGEINPDTDTRDPEDIKTPIVDPSTDPTKPEITPGTSGSAIIVAVSNMYFANINAGIGDQVSYARPVKLKEGVLNAAGNKLEEKPGATELERGAYAQFGDIRTDKDGYTITAEFTKQFTKSTGEELAGTVLDYAHGIVNGDDDSLSGTTNAEKAAHYPTLKGTSMKLSVGGGAETIVTATGKQGKGLWAVEFGQSNDFAGNVVHTGTKGTAGQGVKLTVPAATSSNMVKGDYAAEVTWSLVVAP